MWSWREPTSSAVAGCAPATRIDLGAARHRLVDALRAYDAALDASGAPTPYRLRDELRLLEAIDRRDLSV